MGLLSELRYEPIAKRIRGHVDGTAVVDTHRALLVWEPKRVTPIFAVPEDELKTELIPGNADQAAAREYPIAIMLDAPPALDPRTSFSRHTTPGTPLTLRTGSTILPGAAFRPDDGALAGYVLLDFDAFSWYEDDEEIIGHPRDPFHRIDVRRSAARVSIQLEGITLAETAQACLLYETFLPPRFYLPPEDVRLDLMEASTTTTVCPYKGKASYYSYPESPKGQDIAWQYDSRFPDATQIHGLVCFFDEKVDVTVDGQLQRKSITPWS
ncbi:DUF427 domain-containing protein [Arthrobacter tumbae]